MDFSSVRIVLVCTSHPGNIGAAARAMKNMGLSRLFLVKPRDFPSGVATGRASSALDVLDNAVVCETLEEAIADCALVMGTSARSRSMPWPMQEPREGAARVAREMSANQVALVFGREHSGLSNEELQLCHYHIQIPANEDYSSLNLAAAVMVLCYEVRMAVLEKTAGVETIGEIGEDWDKELATQQEMASFLDHLEDVLVDLDFHDRDNPRLLMRRMRRMYSRIRPDKMEINILRGMLSAIKKASKGNNQGC